MVSFPNTILFYSILSLESAMKQHATFYLSTSMLNKSYLQNLCTAHCHVLEYCPSLSPSTFNISQMSSQKSTSSENNTTCDKTSHLVIMRYVAIAVILYHSYFYTQCQRIKRALRSQRAKGESSIRASYNSGRRWATRDYRDIRTYLTADRPNSGVSVTG